MQRNVTPALTCEHRQPMKGTVGDDCSMLRAIDDAPIRSARAFIGAVQAWRRVSCNAAVSAGYSCGWAKHQAMETRNG